jgi:cysteine-rich repeat protein
MSGRLAVMVWAGASALAGCVFSGSFRPDELAGGAGGGGDAGAGASGASGGAGGAGASAGAGGSGAGAGGAGGSAGSGGAAVCDGCGDGALAACETCDDKNTTANDGCSTTCLVEPGFACMGTPSVCTPIEPVAVTKTGLTASPVDNGYDGSLGSMVCVPMPVQTPFLSVQLVKLRVGIAHRRVGDLVLKLVAPTGEVATLFSRPGLAEGADNGSGDGGDTSNLKASVPIAFADDAPFDAETIGAGIGDLYEVCEDDNRCAFRPNPDSALDTGLAGLVGLPASGTWQVCLGDGSALFDGEIRQVELEVLAW